MEGEVQKLVHMEDRLAKRVIGQRSAIEAVSNAVRHADASTVTVSIAVKEETIRIVVADDGKGLAEGISPSGLGNLRDRAEASGGTFSLDSGPEGGVRIEWSAPVS